MPSNLRLQFQNGTLDETPWLSYHAALPDVDFYSEFGRNIWSYYSFAFAPGFVESVNIWLEESNLVGVDNEVMFNGTKLL